MKTDLELRHLRVFLTVVETGTHTRAARALGLSQSTVSETMFALERALGTPLFRKNRKGATLTPAGAALLPYAKRMLALTNELVASLARLTTDINATLTVSAVESINTYVLPAHLAALREHWPKARIDVRVATCPEIREDVAAGKSDIGLILEEDLSASEGVELAHERFAVFGAPGHPLSRGRASPEQLRRFDFYMSDAAGSYHRALRHYFDAAQVPLPRTQGLGTVEGVKRGIMAGGSALGLLPAYAVAQELEDGLVVEVRPNPGLPRLVMRAIVAGPHPPMVEALIETLKCESPT